MKRMVDRVLDEVVRVARLWVSVMGGHEPGCPCCARPEGSPGPEDRLEPLHRVEARPGDELAHPVGGDGADDLGPLPLEGDAGALDPVRVA